MTQRTRLTVVIAGLLLAASVSAAPRGPREGRHVGPEYAQVMERLGQAVGQLDLSEDQRSAIRSEFEAFRETVRPLAMEMRQGREALRDVVTAATYDAEAAAGIAQRQGSLAAKLMTASADAAAAVLARLTDEQRAELKDMAEFRREHRAEHRAMARERKREHRPRQHGWDAQEAPEGE